jgi:uncharacterized protein (DUF433 family)
LPFLHFTENPTSEVFTMPGDASTKTEYAHIVRSPGVLGGEPRVEGHRIRVRDIAAARDLDGLTPEEIVARVYPQLTLAQAYAALAYYEDHHEEIVQVAEDEARYAERFLKEHPQLVRHPQ